MNSRLFARLALAAGLIALAVVVRPGSTEKAQAQGVSISVEFRSALEPHGRWHRHDRFGEVWIPARVDREWRPYTRGRWVYTEDWGWYWISNKEEEWGWVAYHYGRWYRDREVGWVWIPGNEWGPAWVSWRRGGEQVGWAALPPDDLYAEYDDDPEVWVFVRSRDVIAPSIIQVVLPRPRVVLLVRETVVVSRTRYISGVRVAANVGVPPSYLRVAVPVSRVRPVVIRGTAQVRGAIEVDGKNAKRARRAEVQKAGRTITPAKDVPKPERVERGETRQTPDAPKVLQQAQPQQQKKDGAKQDQKKDDAAPKAESKKDDTQQKNETKQKQDAKQKDDSKQKDDAKQKRDEPSPKEEKQKEDAQKAKQEKRDDDTKSRQKDDDNGKAQQKRNETQPKQTPKRDDRPDNLQKKDDGARGEQKQQREPQQKQDAGQKGGNGQPKAGPPQKQQAPERQKAPSKGPEPGPMPDKKDN